MFLPYRAKLYIRSGGEISHPRTTPRRMYYLNMAVINGATQAADSSLLLRVEMPMFTVSEEFPIHSARRYRNEAGAKPARSIYADAL